MLWLGFREDGLPPAVVRGARHKGRRAGELGLPPLAPHSGPVLLLGNTVELARKDVWTQGHTVEHAVT